MDTAQGQAASLIGQSGADYLSHKLAHALVGCVAGAAAGGACKDGAIGGAVGEIVAEMFKDQRPGLFSSDAEKQSFNAKVLAYSKLVSGAVSAYSGGNAQTAITTAEVAVANNFLSYNRSNSRASQWGSFKQELDSCKVTAGCDVGGVYNRWTLISNDQQKQAMGSMDALFAANPSEASTAGQWFGKAVSSMYMDPRDVCSTGDNRCISFVQTQQNQAMAVYRSGLSLAYANDLVDGGGRVRSSLLEAPASVSKTPGAKGGVTAGELTIGERAVANALENGQSATAPVGRGGSPMSVTPGTNAPAAIGGVNYSGHALDQMQGRGVIPSAVKSTIENGTIFSTGPGTTGYYEAAANLRVIVNSTNGRVVTVIPGKP